MFAVDRVLVRQVRVDGANRVSEDRVRDWLMTRAGMPLDSLLLEQDMARILEGYLNAGYWQVSVAFPEVEPNRGRVRFRIEEGRRTLIDKIRITGNVYASTDSLQNEMFSRGGSPLIRESLEVDVEALLKFYENRGYPYCSLAPDVSLSPGSRSAQVRIVVDEGPFVRLDTIRFTGNRITRDETLRREMRLAQGGAYDQRRVDRALRALRRLPFVLDVDDPLLVTEPDGRTALVVSVRESPAGRAEGVVGVVPASRDGVQGLSGSFATTFVNLLGTGRRADASWSRSGSGASDLDLRYHEPWILSRPLGLDVGLLMRQRPGFAENRMSLGVSLSTAGGAEVRLGASRGGVRPDSSGVNGFAKGRIASLDGAFELDRRNDRWNPTSGSLYRVGLEWSRVAQAAGAGRRLRATADLQRILSLGRRTALAASLHGAGVAETGVGLPDGPLRLGGAASIRGYREEAFLVNRALWMNLEWRVILARRSRAFLFVDAGVLGDSAGGERDGLLFPVGFGMGIRTVSRVGTIGLEYGLARTDSPGRGKVHVRMVNDF
ncbi:MAG: BamA/TamA family outer membrane protein [Gemmatimonadota bacterium]|nr:BamA/TamA family outer membrane protein [Gemmatimonadota bacterium]